MDMRKFVNKTIRKVFSSTPHISPIRQQDIPECLDVCSKVFSNVMSPSAVKTYISGSANWGISVKIEYKGKIVGCYILNNEPVSRQNSCSSEDLSRYKQLNGVQGIGLAVLPEYRKLGIGKKLREYPIKKGYDYIWGLHLKGLHNIDNWIKFGRRIVCDSGDMFTTLMDISSKAKNMTTKAEEPLNKEKQPSLNESEFSNFHSFQEAGHTCGPTCVKMVADFLGVGHKGIENIINLCGCNTKTGTVDTGIKNALDSLGISNERNPHREDAESAMNYLNSLLENGNVFIMRTLTRGIKHWIIIYGKKDGKFLVADPWLGKINYDENQILGIWEPRDFDGFLVKR